jgi:hypothetical protein
MREPGGAVDWEGIIGWPMGFLGLIGWGSCDAKPLGTHSTEYGAHEGERVLGVGFQGHD